MRTQNLFALQNTMPANLRDADESKPFFTVAVRTDGIWVCMVRTNDFLTLTKGLAFVTGLMEQQTGCWFLLVERQEQDPNDDCSRLSTVLTERQMD